jgi:hypothetical protein
MEYDEINPEAPSPPCCDTSPKAMAGRSFSHYGSLYYTGDAQPPAGDHYIKDGKAVSDSEFVIGPATGRDWCDAGDRLWTSIRDHVRKIRVVPAQLLINL